jgi:hypothetical protein
MIALIVAAIGVVLGVVFFVIPRFQRRSTRKWTAKFYEAARLASKGWGPSSWLSIPNEGQKQACLLMFPDKELRDLIEFYLVSVNSSLPSAHVRPPRGSRLSMPEVRTTIAYVLARVELFKREHPDWARQIGI